MRTHRREGFTLLEILVALTILSVLTCFAIPEYLRLVHEAKLALRAQNLATLNNAVQDHFRDHGCYPTTLQALADATHPYIEEVPVDPFTGRSSTWLVASKSHWLARPRRFYRQSDFPMHDPMNEGIYKVKEPFIAR